MDKAISQEFSNTPHQKCIVLLQRILQNYVRAGDKKSTAADFRDVLSPDDSSYTKEQAYKSLLDFGNKWGKKYKQSAKYITNLEWQPNFVYFDYSVKIRGAFPDEEPVLALIRSVAIDKSEKTYKYPIYNFKFEDKLMKNKP